MSFCRTRSIKAGRKVRKCQWCAEVIHLGAPAIYNCTVFEGDFQSGYFHPECFEPCGEYCNREGDGEFMAGEGVRGKPQMKEGA